ncbi:hypothetical protein, partial [Arthrobacter oryzae]|uniref:hypothetical protein n=1 Tax=Arthrobacter oryzae TaxID=409290 RepID=UPI001C82EA4E
MDDPNHVECALVVGVDDELADVGVSVVAGSAAPSAGSWHQSWPRRQAGPLAPVMMELIEWLVAQGYAPTTQRNHVRAAARLGGSSTFSVAAGVQHACWAAVYNNNRLVSLKYPL